MGSIREAVVIVDNEEHGCSSLMRALCSAINDALRLLSRTSKILLSGHLNIFVH
jgi:hypothetical protein